MQKVARELEIGTSRYAHNDSVEEDQALENYAPVEEDIRFIVCVASLLLIGLEFAGQDYHQLTHFFYLALAYNHFFSFVVFNFN
mgnify:FL=1